MTVAMSLLVHGEAVRFNRGQSRGDDFDFKYMKGRDGREYPYVSSQCFKKYWRESLPGALSPIIREERQEPSVYLRKSDRVCGRRPLWVHDSWRDGSRGGQR